MRQEWFGGPIASGVAEGTEHRAGREHGKVQVIAGTVVSQREGDLRGAFAASFGREQRRSVSCTVSRIHRSAVENPHARDLARGPPHNPGRQASSTTVTPSAFSASIKPSTSGE